MPLESNPEAMNKVDNFAFSTKLQERLFLSSIYWYRLLSFLDFGFQFLENVGVRRVTCLDVLSFDDELLAFVPKPHYALVLCFPECELVCS